MSRWKSVVGSGMAIAMMMVPTVGIALAQGNLPANPSMMIAATESGGDPAEKDDLFAGAEKFGKNAKEVNEVSLDKNLLQMAGKSKGGEKGDLAGKMDFITVRSYEYALEGQYNRADVDEFRKRLEGNGWAHIVHSHEAKEDSDVWMKSDNEGQMSEMVVISAEPRELSFVHLKGHMSAADLSKMGSRYGAPPVSALQHR